MGENAVLKEQIKGLKVAFGRKDEEIAALTAVMQFNLNLSANPSEDATVAEGVDADAAVGKAFELYDTSRSNADPPKSGSRFSSSRNMNGGHNRWIIFSGSLPLR